MNIEKQYLNLLQEILDNGTIKKNRTGIDTISIFGKQIRHKMSEGFPLLTTKKMAWKGITSELLWFLRGDTNIKWLVDNGNYIWVGDAYKNYQRKGKIVVGENQEYGKLLSKENFIEEIKTNDEFAKEWGDLGPIYGKQWRDWTGFKQGWNAMADTEYPHEYDTKGIDQIQELINKLQNNPDDRRMMVSAWNVGEIDQMVLPPCHYGFQVYTRELTIVERCHLGYKYVDPFEWDMIMGNGEKGDEENCDFYKIPKRAISLMWNQRSVDTPLGLPFNIASYALLLEILGKITNMVPDELIGNLGDTHIYVNQIDGIKEQLKREPKILPTLDIHPGILDYDIDKLELDMFTLKNYESHSAIKIPLSN